MSTNLLYRTAFNLSKIQLVHSIPGRLRVKIPILKYVKNKIEPQEIESFFQRYRLKGIQSLNVNFISSKALILYDKDVTSDKHILTFLNRVREKLYEIVTKEEKMTINKVDEMYKELKEEGYEFEAEL
ncbi:HMA2 domain-containing protein [Marinifilum caeruleilacunae]|uniref:Heavy-metal-associated domain-containing protein n=1 Tax=Marinifilum caeruleilacunae TaxID=2499076 RepID=A0ABX1WX79_9BACT|nr:hypothetical protein [Marinifilum caeruleilacunae]NOU60716.1 hypothetical protein [Marinifilum caeruleilacunae]